MQYLSLDEIKQIELDILIKFDEFCKKENLYYTLAGGTLLGAIRHKGFIPWDDDIDVIMSRDDYNRFLKVFTEKNFLVRYLCLSLETTNIIILLQNFAIIRLLCKWKIIHQYMAFG